MLRALATGDNFPSVMAHERVESRGVVSGPAEIFFGANFHNPEGKFWRHIGSHKIRYVALHPEFRAVNIMTALFLLPAGGEGS